MIGTVSIERRSRSLEFGIYRDGDNNLDTVQAQTIAQAVDVSQRNRAIEFTVEDTTSRRGFLPARALRTESYTVADGAVSSNVHVTPPHDMADRDNLSAFVAHTLDNAERSGAKATWLDLIDHGGGDGGGLESDHGSGVMRADDIAGAIADGIALHARQHPEDAGRRIDGVVANQCLMATEAFSLGYYTRRAKRPVRPLPPPRVPAQRKPVTLSPVEKRRVSRLIAKDQFWMNCQTGAWYPTPP